MKLPNDITRCANADCPLKENCLRWLDKVEGLVWYSDFKPENNKCGNQIHINKKTEIKHEKI